MPRAPEQVFEFISEPANLASWWPRVVRIEAISDSPTREGGVWTKVLEAGSGRRLRLDYTCIEFASGKTIGWRHELRDSGLENHLREQSTRIEILPAEAGATVRITATADLKGTARLVAPAMKKEQRRMVEGAIEGLGAAFEGAGESE